MGDKNRIDPPLKWAGGKRLLLSKIQALTPIKYNKYIEPFFGGGALFFAIQPKNAIISDINPDLMQFYKQISRNPQEVIQILNNWKYNKDFYYSIRKQKLTDPNEKASRFLYLNKCCWNGLYRVNKKGEFNVPFGKFSNSIKIFNEKNLLEVSNALKKTKIVSKDFEDVIKFAKRGDFVYLDPPYTVKHGNNGFIKYNEKIFSWKDQERLANTVKKISKKGVYLMISNAHVKEIKELYDRFFINEVSRVSVISGNIKGRGKVKELIITTYKPPRIGDF